MVQIRYNFGTIIILAMLYPVLMCGNREIEVEIEVEKINKVSR